MTNQELIQQLREQQERTWTRIKEEEAEAKMHLNHLMQCIRDDDTNNFTLEDWRRVALAGSIYWQ